ncbi:MATE family efflux transporter, partial [Raoultella terrigena]|uniref:MATE family efflux transporter n=1 Tax=Raoultella terrigena TaxID=577 RepID=UPI0021697E03
MSAQPQPRRAGPREVLALAVPAFLALVAEPLFLMVDAAVVGRLGVVPLAGLGTASSVLLTAAGVFVFLAYGTTSVVARQVGAGSPRGAIEVGTGGVWLAGGLGVVAALVVGSAARPIAGVFGSS